MKKYAKLRIIIPIVHFIFSFLFERIMGAYSDDIILPLSKTDIITLSGEKLMGYLISKVFAFLFIIFFWMLVYYVKDNFRRPFVKGFLVLFIVGLVVVGLCFPECFGYGVYGEHSDNLITFSYALRFLPEYWHSAYSSLIYSASMQVFPTPFAIPLFQWLFLVFVLGFVYARVSNELNVNGYKKYLCLLMFLLPESWFLITYAYRTEGYAILCMFFFSLVLLDCITKRKRSISEMLGICALAGFVSVWRTEGIILGFFGILTLLWNNYRNEKKKYIGFVGGFVVSFLLLSFPQKIGDMKYYGSDYTIINSFAVIRNIFNRIDSNITYEGAKKDIAAIEAVVPVEAIRLYGLEGYRKYNCLMGRKDINQSVSSFEAGSAYSKAYRNLCLHNIKAYALTQIGKLKKAVKFTDEEYIEKIHGTFSLSREYPEYSYSAWSFGEKELLSFGHVAAWRNLSWRKSLGTAVISRVRSIENAYRKSFLATAVITLVIVASFVCLIYDIVCLIKGKKGQYFCFLFVSLALFTEAGAIFLVMPAGVLSYFRAVFMCMFLMLYIRLAAFSSQYRLR